MNLLNGPTEPYYADLNPTWKTHTERFNRTARHEWLDLHLCESLDHAQNLATPWQWQYNNERLGTVIGRVPQRRLLLAA